jgi:hypothetical protein
MEPRSCIASCACLAMGKHCVVSFTSSIAAEHCSSKLLSNVPIHFLLIPFFFFFSLSFTVLFWLLPVSLSPSLPNCSLSFFFVLFFSPCFLSFIIFRFSFSSFSLYFPVSFFFSPSLFLLPIFRSLSVRFLFSLVSPCSAFFFFFFRHLSFAPRPSSYFLSSFLFLLSRSSSFFLSLSFSLSPCASFSSLRLSLLIFWTSYSF